MNPLVPTVLDAVWMVLALAAFALSVTALVSVARARECRLGERLLWAVLVIVVPLIGPSAWFVAGRAPARAGARSARRERAASANPRSTAEPAPD